MFGVFNLDKPTGVTSRDVVNVVQRMVKPTKVGHAGTLDPMATGVLLVCVGPATRLISLLQQSPKTYVAEFRLGEQSDTDDSTGTVQVFDGPSMELSVSQIQNALAAFVGTIEQVPPAFSAVKVKGQRAYAKARRGEDVQLQPKEVTIHSIEVLDFAWPTLSLKITCGSGTYIRSIARDLGRQLGCGGLMSALQRTAIGAFSVECATAPESLSPENLSEHMADPIQIVANMLKYHCSADEQQLLQAGRVLEIVSPRLQLPPENSSNNNSVALVCAEGRRLLALGELQDDGAKIQPRAVLIPRG